MSTWYETDEDQIIIIHPEEKVDICVSAFRGYGYVYKTLTFKQIEEIYEEINNGANKTKRRN